MSGITYRSFSKLHIKQLEDTQYKSGYEYAKQRLVATFQSMELSELFFFLRTLREDGYSKRNYYAIGQAHAVIELIHIRLDGGGYGGLQNTIS